MSDKGIIEVEKNCVVDSLAASRRKFMKMAVGSVGVLAAGGSAISAIAAPGQKSGVMAAPSITCGTSTQASINITVTAGSTGAPAGFSIQWMTNEAFTQFNTQNFTQNVWPPSDSSLLCKASFSGNASLSRYSLAAGEAVTVNIGELLFDNGASTNCIEALTCGTNYVFRAFAHATSTLNRSEFTQNLVCNTLPCSGSGGGCTYTQGYWKTHGPIPTGNNEYVWPQSVKDNGMMLGAVTYTASQLLGIFNTPAQGNGLLALAHQLIAAKLNIANGADGTSVVSAIAGADGLIGSAVVPPVGGGSLAPSLTSSLINFLSLYNEGGTGPGHCS